jgi:hypothetical protein
MTNILFLARPEFPEDATVVALSAMTKRCLPQYSLFSAAHPSKMLTH